MTVGPSPHVVVHVAVSLDGSTTGFEPDVACFYSLARSWQEDVTLVGADTILAQEPALAGAPRPGPDPDGPLLAVVDSGRRVREWEALRDCGHWSGVVALRADSGQERVDLAAALARLGEQHGARVVRVDSGGGLTGALLHAGLVDELSLLLHPCVAGGHHPWYGSAPAPARKLEPLASRRLDDGLVWLRYRVVESD
jgi:2,5-diamino-6-(ribosylamino)-4(3H)-pyrimidinone 5'-phosphate reductase